MILQYVMTITRAQTRRKKLRIGMMIILSLVNITRCKRNRVCLDGSQIQAFEGEMIASALVAVGVRTFRLSSKHNEPRGLFCAIGRCTDCVMEVDGEPNVRTCITPVKAGMVLILRMDSGSGRRS